MKRLLKWNNNFYCIYLDCTAPYIINFHTDDAADTSSAIAPASRGQSSDLHFQNVDK
jgi:hypothetical protein